MRVLLDANVLISYLLTPRSQGAVAIIVRAGLSGQYTPLLPTALLQEVANRVSRKRDLANRIPKEDLDELLSLLMAAGEVPPELTEAFPAVTRDPKDDYLLAYALLAGADYLVTGDADLLSLGRIEQLQILTPAEFRSILGG